MNLVARTAFGFVLLSMAAPTVSFADTALNQFTPIAQAQPAQKSVRGKSSAARAQSSSASARSFSADSGSYGAPHWISVAQRYKGTNPTGRRSLWCADFLNLVLQNSGMKGTSSSMASSFASYGQRLSGPKVGAIAVLSRGKSGGHVGIVTGFDSSGNPILLSGNHNNTVAEAPYSAGRVIAYVWPAG